MGIFKFMKDAGEKVLEQKKDEKYEVILKKYLAKNELPSDTLEINFNGKNVVLGGEVDTQSTKEKILVAIGNIRGVEEVEDKMTVLEEAPEAKYYTVQKGDWLSKIAKKEYGNANKYMAIFEANKPMLSDPDKIYPGQVLIIPPLEA